MFRFEKIDVWRQAINFADLIYDISRSFPREEQFGLTSQVRRAAVSISSNVAEGTSRSSDRDFLRFVEIAYGSLREVVSQAHSATNQNMVEKAGFKQIRDTAEELAKKLSAL